MELEGLNKDRLPQDAAAEQPWQKLFQTIFCMSAVHGGQMASFACLDLNLPVAWPKQASYLKRNVSLLIRGMS